MLSAHDIIVRPVLTEKSYANMAVRKYTFEVAKDADKTAIKKAVEELFNVDVEKVNTLVRCGKLRRQGKSQGYTAKRRFAIVKLTEKSRGIEFFEGMANN